MDFKKIKNHKTLNSLQVRFEIVTAILYIFVLFIGIFIFISDTLYHLNTTLNVLILASTVTNLVISNITKNSTRPLTIANVFAACITFIPIIGFFSALLGIVLSVISIIIIAIFKDNQVRANETGNVVDVEASVVDKLD